MNDPVVNPPSVTPIRFVTDATYPHQIAVWNAGLSNPDQSRLGVGELHFWMNRLGQEPTAFALTNVSWTIDCTGCTLDGVIEYPEIPNEVPDIVPPVEPDLPPPGDIGLPTPIPDRPNTCLLYTSPSPRD